VLRLLFWLSLFRAKTEEKLEKPVFDRNRKTEGEPIEKIMRYTGLTKERIENWKV